MSWDARPSPLVHATEELLEEYSFGRIHEPQLGWLEEHLLICPECQEALDDIEEYKVFMKAGLASFERERLAAAGHSDSPTRPDSRAGQWSALRRVLSPDFTWFRMPGARSLSAAAVLFVLAGTAVTWRIESSPVAMGPVATIRLIALRGGEGDAARAPSGSPLDLVFSLRDLPGDVFYGAEVVSSSGRRMWTGNVRIAEQNLSIHLAGPLRAGAYWVRLYSSNGQLLREFGLRVE